LRISQYFHAIPQNIYPVCFAIAKEELTELVTLHPATRVFSK
jgi:hypothetical protein